MEWHHSGRVKLQKRYAYTTAGKDYHKFVVTLPPDQIDGLGWDHGQELEAIPRKDGILLRPVSNARVD